MGIPTTEVSGSTVLVGSLTKSYVTLCEGQYKLLLLMNQNYIKLP